ncbi:bifunctional DNA primase/polymerase [Streptomyces johnsoniae]|uniref:Bifunctional DNA primase/polymerase n=1 Tax=Streptomyces johnsoniae TaxID=3075532 RepID=A0ABU2S0B5_9ACTN|nr:bifunctional DNA primase/polymerase [Streptomyces sp. DSM 41886]MDT0441874.1 bifunctional DNA primase/polymerase [Streptomyces sp. DSM 41886]
MEETSARTAGDTAPPLARQFGGNLLEHALQYVKERHWEVLPGAWLESDSGATRCSCAVPACGAPGAHPLRRDWTTHATGSTAEVRRLWSREPRAAILLPTGRTFDVFDVPETAGCLALARMERSGVAPGPVAATPAGRMQFFVLPGGAAKAPGLLRQLGWSPAALSLSVRGEGDFVAAPPTRMGRRGAAQWVHRPTSVNRWLPDAAEVIAPLAYACGQEP